MEHVALWLLKGNGVRVVDTGGKGMIGAWGCMWKGSNVMLVAEERDGGSV